MTENDIEATASLLKTLEPGFLPYPIFEQVARLVCLPILEFIPLRKVGDRIEVLLIERPKNDSLWPNVLHTPGTVIRATDLNQDQDTNWPALDRILHEELLDTKVSSPHYVGSILHESKRGVEQAQLYWIEVLGEEKVGAFYNAESLPENFMESQRAFVNAAVASFKKFYPIGN
jgi:hypothetical protein